MRTKYTFIMTFFAVFSISMLATIAVPPFAWAQDENRAPFVSNVHAEQLSGSKLMEINYDVADPDGDLLTITAAISNDGGRTFTVPAASFTGDIGSRIVPGPGKRIVWYAGTDVPGVYDTDYRVKITASDVQTDKETITGRDGATMKLIPAGEFQMGDAFSEGDPDERPVHTVYVDAFYMDVYEVTNSQYRRFIEATGHVIEATEHGMPRYWFDARHNSPAQPVSGASWDDVAAYAQWAGKRLPTEAEWEKAARGGLAGRRYPWGDGISHDSANYSGAGGRDRWDFSAPVGSFPANGYGLYDMAGNVWEWCSDWYDSRYYLSSPPNNPQGPDPGSQRVLRGGSWNSDADALRASHRYFIDPTTLYSGFGFRCVMPAGTEHSAMSNISALDTRDPRPPVVSDIPDQTVAEGSTFVSISLDDYVSDADHEDAEMIWTYSGNVELFAIIGGDHTAIIAVPDPEWNGSEVITFTATDPDGLSSSDSATFTVTAVNDPPVMSDIPDQTIEQSEVFARVILDDYISDMDNEDAEMIWTHSGSVELSISISDDRVATIAVPDQCWNGSETILFIVRDPGGESKGDSATFTVLRARTAQIFPPTAKLEIGAVERFSIGIHLINDQWCDIPNQDVRWAVEGGIGSISETGLFTAKRPGNGRIKATLKADTSVVARSDTITVVSLPWDVNSDGIIDVSDLMLVASALGTSGEGLPADINADGVVDIRDLVIVAAHYAETTNSNK
ncbi:SUMF1/EgtB/PvdO family nonheme iron enzyme [Candidatus Poribacteria bacterium]